MVLRPCARPPKQGLHGGDVVMFVANKIKNNIKYYMLAINNIKY